MHRIVPISAAAMALCQTSFIFLLSRRMFDVPRQTSKVREIVNFSSRRVSALISLVIASRSLKARCQVVKFLSSIVSVESLVEFSRQVLSLSKDEKIGGKLLIVMIHKDCVRLV